MHDPTTLAFDIRCFWMPRDKDGFRPSFISIWHVDPEVGGDDNSCGWTYPNIPKDRVAELKKLAAQEFDFLLGQYGYEMTPFELIYSSWSLIAWRFFKRRSLTHKELLACIDLATNPSDNLRSRCHPDSPEELAGLFYPLYRCYSRLHRPWYKHPRWHVHHWRFQVHPLQHLRRWLFDRCASCGKRFSWGYSPTSFGAGDLFHHDCARSARKAGQEGDRP